MRSDKDMFSDFLKRNGDIALKKPESLLRARAEGLNNTEVDYLFYLCRNLQAQLHICDKPYLIFSMDEPRLPRNNISTKIVNIQGVRECDLLHAAVYVMNLFPLSLFLKGVRCRKIYKQDLLQGLQLQ